MFEKPLNEQQQWEVETGIAERIAALHAVRMKAATAEQDAERLRAREADLLEEIRAHRLEIGLPDTAIPDDYSQSSSVGAR